MLYQENVKPGQVYDIFFHATFVGRRTIESLAEIGSLGEEMWKCVGSASTVNVALHIKYGWWKIHSQNPLNGQHA